MFGLATDVLDARIALARNQTAAAVKLFQHAVATQDSLAYIEPPDWYYPVRESLGAALLRGGDAKAAERVFRDDLSRNLRNGRSLFGLAESLKAQGDVADAGWAHRSFDEAWLHADVTISINDL
jgi:Flp pilus assembly protein TadD